MVNFQPHIRTVSGGTESDIVSVGRTDKLRILPNMLYLFIPIAPNEFAVDWCIRHFLRRTKRKISSDRVLWVAGSVHLFHKMVA